MKKGFYSTRLYPAAKIRTLCFCRNRYARTYGRFHRAAHNIHYKQQSGHRKNGCRVWLHFYRPSVWGVCQRMARRGSCQHNPWLYGFVDG